jgi:uncharacterized protein YprB with RNaseH-like and TPR domain
MKGPKILFLDIETAPLLGHVWGLWDNNVAINQIERDWHVLSWAAKWSNKKKVMQKDQSKAFFIEDDSHILKPLWKLLDQADIVVTQNGKKFDIPKLNARFITHKMNPPSSFKQIDTYQLAKKHFGFSSHKLEYMTNTLCTKYKKLTQRKFSGFDLWRGCLEGNKSAWKEMAKYNKYDVLSLEELYTKLIPWDTSVNFSVYHEDKLPVCSCGSKSFNKNGYFYSSTGRYQRYSCKKCGAEYRSRKNELSKPKMRSLRVGTKR